jgi:hypothetical protein
MEPLPWACECIRRWVMAGNIPKPGSIVPCAHISGYTGPKLYRGARREDLAVFSVAVELEVLALEQASWRRSGLQGDVRR